MNIREIHENEYPLLQDFLYNAIFLPPGTSPVPREIIFTPEIFIYVEGFGGQHSDCGVVAEQNGNIIGAAWTRIISAYGHIADDTPELAISVLPECRGQSKAWFFLVVPVRSIIIGRSYIIMVTCQSKPLALL